MQTSWNDVVVVLSNSIIKSRFGFGNCSLSSLEMFEIFKNANDGFDVLMGDGSQEKVQMVFAHCGMPLTEWFFACRFPKPRSSVAAVFCLLSI